MPERKKREKRDIIGRDVIGIDETHNGFHLNRAYPNTDLPLLVVGYLYKNYPGSQKSNGKYEAKGGMLGTSKPMQDKEKQRAYTYLLEHPHFLYTTINERETKEQDIFLLRSYAISSLIFNFFQKYSLKENKTTVVIDYINTFNVTQFCQHHVESLLESNDLNVPIFFQHKADFHNQAVKFSDRIGYYLAAMRFRLGKSNWPYGGKKIPISSGMNYTRRREFDFLNDLEESLRKKN